MGPALAALQATNGRLMQSVFSGYISLLSPISPDCLHLIVCKTRKPMSFSRLSRSVRALIGVVAHAGRPPQIRCFAVRSISIIVGAFHSIGARPKESGRHKDVQIECFSHAINAKPDSKISTDGMNEWATDSTRDKPHAATPCRTHSRLAADSAEIANREKPLESDHWLPDFMHTKEHAMIMQQLQFEGHGAAKNRSMVR